MKLSYSFRGKIIDNFVPKFFLRKIRQLKMGQDFHVQFCPFILTNIIFSFETLYFSVLTVTIGLTFFIGH